MSSSNKSAEQQGFAALSSLSQSRAGRSGWAGRLLSPLLNRMEGESADWAEDAEYSIVESREQGARGLLYLLAGIFLLLLVWASLAPVEQVSRGEGKVIPASQLQIVQSTDGGVVREIHVREGERVSTGDVLVRIDPTRFVSSFQETEVRIFALQARVQRLNALLDDETWQPGAAEQPLTIEQSAVLAREQAFYAESRNELEQRLAIAREQLSQQRQALDEAGARNRAAERAVSLLQQEIEVTRPLLVSGAVSEVDLLRLERDLAAAIGERQRAAADSRRQAAAVEEAQARIAEVGHSIRNRWRAELSEATAELGGLQKGSVALADRVRSADLRAPVSGIVQRVLYNTPGGVVAPGDPVVEIVPSDERLLVEAQIAPRDIAFLRPGLPANIKLHAYDFAIYGGIAAELQHISADSITDDQGNTFYLVRAITEELSLSEALEVMPGMTAQLDIITGERTVLSYLLKPVLRAKANALGER